jgi:hypothetical protein
VLSNQLSGVLRKIAEAEETFSYPHSSRLFAALIKAESMLEAPQAKRNDRFRRMLKSI